MITTAIDSNILIDVLFEGSHFSQLSADALTRSAEQGTIILSAVVLAEVAGYFPDEKAVHSFMKDSCLSVTEFGPRSAMAAGKLWRGRAHKDRARILPDYMVAAHAVENADRLLTRDTGFTRMKVPGLVIVTPQDVVE